MFKEEKLVWNDGKERSEVLDWGKTWFGSLLIRLIIIIFCGVCRSAYLSNSKIFPTPQRACCSFHS